jgi:hypothetical protein
MGSTGKLCPAIRSLVPTKGHLPHSLSGQPAPVVRIQSGFAREEQLEAKPQTEEHAHRFWHATGAFLNSPLADWSNL